jgi:hypothetical protein
MKELVPSLTGKMKGMILWNAGDYGSWQVSGKSRIRWAQESVTDKAQKQAGKLMKKSI